MQTALQPLGVGSIDASEAVERLLSRRRGGNGIGWAGRATLRRRRSGPALGQRSHVAHCLRPQFSIVVRRR